MAMTALISVSDKTGLVELCRRLVPDGIRLIATGGTARHLMEHDIPVEEVAAITGSPELLDGRVKTLHPRIHAGILARRDHPEDMEQLAARDIAPIDLVICNLYPFWEVAGTREASPEVLEQIDIGGPTMIRAAAKDYPNVWVVVDPGDYERLPDLLEADGAESERLQLALKAFRHTGFYDALIGQTLATWQRGDRLAFPETLVLPFRRLGTLRYGENPHQRAALYGDVPLPVGTVTAAEQLQGKDPSFINIYDADRGWRAVQEFEEPACVAIKHGTPCGVAARSDGILPAFEAARDADPVSIFGGVVAVNRPIDGVLAAALVDILLHVVVAPGVTDEAREILARREGLRVLDVGTGRPPGPVPSFESKRVEGGLLIQEPDLHPVDPQEWRTVTERQPSSDELAELEFAWRVMRHVISNAIVLTSGRATTGIGAGQVSRIDAARIAIAAAGEAAAGSVLASDAFFPFPDVVEAAADAGVTAIAQPGGSIRDDESIEAANAHGIAMVFTGTRHFRH